ncbi:MAG: CobW family GTP-binding protein [Gaiellales bacterium]
MSGERTPLTLITGFLGSGKTTLLSELLRDPLLGDAVVLVNELGEVPLDHHLLREVDEKTVILDSGCVCCTIRTDLVDELRDLEVRVHRGEIPAFRRVVVETTGLADPVPVLATLLSDPMLSAHYMADGVVACVDAVNAPLQAERQPEWTKQVVVADRIVLTKTDLADADAVAAEALIRARNPVAEIIPGVAGDVPAARLIGLGVLADERRAEQVTAWLDAVDHGHGHDHAHDHHAGVHAIALRFDEPLDWTMFALWLAMLLQSRGDDVLRVKGLLDTGADGPLVLHGVQHVIHPPSHLAAWPDEDRTSRIVLIVRGIGRDEVAASLRAFDGLAKPASEILA